MHCYCCTIGASLKLRTVLQSLVGPFVFHSAPTNILFGSKEYFFNIIIFEADAQDMMTEILCQHLISLLKTQRNSLSPPQFLFY